MEEFREWAPTIGPCTFDYARQNPASAKGLLVDFPGDPRARRKVQVFENISFKDAPAAGVKRERRCVGLQTPAVLLYVDPSLLMRESEPSLSSGPFPLPLPRSPLRRGSGYRGPATESFSASRGQKKVNVNLPVPRSDSPVAAETPAALSLRRLRIPFF